MSKNPATPRTKEEVQLFYKYYLDGATLKEVNKKYKTDAQYQFKLHGLKRRKTTKTKALRQSNNIEKYYYSYTYKFETISNEIEAYILGFWFSDGWVSNAQAGLKLHIKDIITLEKIKNYICKDIKIQITENTCSFVISSAEVIDNLLTLGCIRNKTYLKLIFPKLNDFLIKHFIRGYFDGDGSIFRDGNRLRCNICSINNLFLESIQNKLTLETIISSINIEYRENKEYKTPTGFSTNCKNMYRLYINRKEDFRKFYNYLYSEATIFLDRKYNKFNNGNIVLTD